MEKSIDIKQYSALALAFMGDAVYEVYVREKILKKTNAPADVLHKMAVKYVKAAAQCEAFDRIESLLTDEELSAFKRGRNAKTNTKAKNAGLAEYKKATGFEALLGYLQLKGDKERLAELLDACGDFE